MQTIIMFNYRNIILLTVIVFFFQIKQQLITSETSLFDILPSFFYHANRQVRKAAIEVYVRRSYLAYDVISVQHDEVK